MSYPHSARVVASPGARQIISVRSTRRQSLRVQVQLLDQTARAAEVLVGAGPVTAVAIRLPERQVAAGAQGPHPELRGQAQGLEIERLRLPAARGLDASSRQDEKRPRLVALLAALPAEPHALAPEACCIVRPPREERGVGQPGRPLGV